eukprot:tig00020675_g12588.t1
MILMRPIAESAPASPTLPSISSASDPFELQSASSSSVMHMDITADEVTQSPLRVVTGRKDENSPEGMTTFLALQDEGDLVVRLLNVLTREKVVISLQVLAEDFAAQVRGLAVAASQRNIREDTSKLVLHEELLFQAEELARQVEDAQAQICPEIDEVDRRWDSFAAKRAKGGQGPSAWFERLRWIFTEAFELLGQAYESRPGPPPPPPGSAKPEPDAGERRGRGRRGRRGSSSSSTSRSSSRSSERAEASRRASVASRRPSEASRRGPGGDAPDATPPRAGASQHQALGALLGADAEGDGPAASRLARPPARAPFSATFRSADGTLRAASGSTAPSGRPSLEGSSLRPGSLQAAALGQPGAGGPSGSPLAGSDGPASVAVAAVRPSALRRREAVVQTLIEHIAKALTQEGELWRTCRDFGAAGAGCAPYVGDPLALAWPEELRWASPAAGAALRGRPRGPCRPAHAPAEEAAAAARAQIRRECQRLGELCTEVAACGEDLASIGSRVPARGEMPKPAPGSRGARGPLPHAASFPNPAPHAPGAPAASASASASSSSAYASASASAPCAECERSGQALRELRAEQARLSSELAAARAAAAAAAPPPKSPASPPPKTAAANGTAPAAVPAAHSAVLEATVAERDRLADELRRARDLVRALESREKLQRAGPPSQRPAPLASSSSSTSAASSALRAAEAEAERWRAKAEGFSQLLPRLAGFVSAMKGKPDVQVAAIAARMADTIAPFVAEAAAASSAAEAPRPRSPTAAERRQADLDLLLGAGKRSASSVGAASSAAASALASIGPQAAALAARGAGARAGPAATSSSSPAPAPPLRPGATPDERLAAAEAELSRAKKEADAAHDAARRLADEVVAACRERDESIARLHELQRVAAGEAAAAGGKGGGRLDALWSGRVDMLERSSQLQASLRTANKALEDAERRRAEDRAAADLEVARARDAVRRHKAEVDLLISQLREARAEARALRGGAGGPAPPPDPALDRELLPDDLPPPPSPPRVPGHVPAALPPEGLPPPSSDAGHSLLGLRSLMLSSVRGGPASPPPAPAPPRDRSPRTSPR